MDDDRVSRELLPDSAGISFNRAGSRAFAEYERRRGPRRGDMANVEGLFSTFGTPCCPPLFADRITLGTARALNGRGSGVFDIVGFTAGNPGFCGLNGTGVTVLVLMGCCNDLIFGFCGRLAPSRGEKGVVVGFFSTFGTPSSPPDPRAPVVGGSGRA